MAVAVGPESFRVRSGNAASNRSRDQRTAIRLTAGLRLTRALLALHNGPARAFSRPAIARDRLLGTGGNWPGPCGVRLASLRFRCRFFVAGVMEDDGRDRRTQLGRSAESGRGSSAGAACPAAFGSGDLVGLRSGDSQPPPRSCSYTWMITARETIPPLTEVRLRSCASSVGNAKARPITTRISCSAAVKRAIFTWRCAAAKSPT